MGEGKDQQRGQLSCHCIGGGDWLGLEELKGEEQTPFDSITILFF